MSNTKSTENTAENGNKSKPLLCDVSFDQKISLKWTKCKTQIRIKINDFDFAVFKKHYNESFWRDLYLPNNKQPQGLCFVKHIGYETIDFFLSSFDNDYDGIIENIVFKGKSNNIT